MLKYCGRGEYRAKVTGKTRCIEKCKKCHDGYYNSHYFHTLTHCFKCTTFNEYAPLMILVENCTRFEDTKIRCKENFYYIKDPTGGWCQACTNCTLRHQFFGKECSDDSDAICCDKENMIIKNGTCEDFVYCGVDEYLQHRTNDEEESCKPCADGCGNSEERHRKRTCEEKKDSNSSNFSIPPKVLVIILQLLLIIIL
ncbi:hypothetical protein PoB_002610900 [Plakobranchus ocellatus]|uniref:TNFR-Cys domain-containing protein n=1 Tax=Plakobranchus ocellatus TaxID=259542 RepID=A0AAV3ZZ12_9GAST|nr:hypothetical protein PoB_002610900 [Plakobranchus ocellatus]